MEPRFLNVYAHPDCSGGLVHVRSGPSANYEPLRSCHVGVETATHTGLYLEGRQYMQIRREFATDVVLDATCVHTGLAVDLFAFVNCSTMAYAMFTDANCSHNVPVVEIAHPHVECFVPNDAAVPSMPHPPPLLKYIKGYANPDCSGPLTYMATLQGVVAIAHDTQSCIDGIELNRIPPRSKDFALSAAYMNIDNGVDANSLALDRACVQFAPRKFLVVDCQAQAITYYSDPLCRVVDAHGAHVVLAPRPSKLPLNCSVPSGDGEMLGVQGDFWAKESVVLVAVLAIAFVGAIWRAVVWRSRRRQSHVRLLK
ncbi:hypothetical protein H310_02378 [Aphanomyces invadans]|uniref:Uncharacterized protein n=1 Tax=Aphanomyces invadans TaxID=157072 RepID=A0A024UQ93_9STRA|nr:hypothetical protein H310_02378 [Aphanomyces invadans]ETW07997.1 hypothetical protein H310_02378 [Aphanomyces invadans]|eukprot:XP_008864090.1 hypothetical protein H310_02378 [Aphanomyces invadans]